MLLKGFSEDTCIINENKIITKNINLKVFQKNKNSAATNQVMELFIVYPCEPLAIDLKLLSVCQEDTTGVDVFTCNLILPLAS
jgi:hypothetical protein